MPKRIDIRPDATNANKGTERGRYMVETSLRETGAGRSILLDADGRIIAGNKTFEAATDIGLPVRIVETDGTELIAVQRTDLDLSDPTGTARKLAYYDNRASQVGLEWDAEQVLADITAGVDLEAMFRQDELDELLKDLLPKTEGDAEPQIDRAAELNEVWQVRTGDVWAIGDHRLVCGDCTDPAAVAKVMMGEKAVLMVTDPPYGVEYDPMFRQEALGAADRRTGVVQNDNRSEWSDAWKLFSGDVVYCWSAMLTAHTVLSSFLSGGFDVHAEIVWSKPHFPFGRGHYVAQHESCWYLVRKGKVCNWSGDKMQSTIWSIALDDTTDGGHGTQKPLECMARPIRNHGQIGDIVFDPFLGSGTTLVACQNLGRRGRGVEISPNYCAVILQRMQDAFGIVGVRLG